MAHHFGRAPLVSAQHPLTSGASFFGAPLLNSSSALVMSPIRFSLVVDGRNGQMQEALAMGMKDVSIIGEVD